eukprot:4822579-Pleurochrysis_carterae.AAC.5
MSADGRGRGDDEMNALLFYLLEPQENSSVATMHQPAQLEQQMPADVLHSPNGRVGVTASGTLQIFSADADESVSSASFGVPLAHGIHADLPDLREQDTEFGELVAVTRVEPTELASSPHASTRGETAVAEFSTPSFADTPTQAVVQQLNGMQVVTPRSHGVSRRRIWVLDDAITAEHSEGSGAAVMSTPAPLNALPSRGALTCSTNKATPGPSCAICLSPVKNRCGSRCSIDPHGDKFKTPCCHQLFHRDCLAKFKARAMYHEPAACPLCRSQQPSGLTPKPVPTGFVTSSSVHAAMLARVAQARNAVQRSLQQGSRPAEQTSPGLDAAFRDALSARDEARAEARA